MKLSWNKYSPLKESTVITTIDVHAAGEPLRIITGGLPEVRVVLFWNDDVTC